jgi:hypothetical protein
MALIHMCISLLLSTCIEVLRNVDNIMCEISGTRSIKYTQSPCTAFRVWAYIINTTERIIYPAYTFNGIGVTFTVAQTVLEVRERFEQLQTQTSHDLRECYRIYRENGAFNDHTDLDDVRTAMIFQHLVQLQCRSIEDLVIKRTYNHPIFGHIGDNVSLTEIRIDSRITISDIPCMLSTRLSSKIEMDDYRTPHVLGKYQKTTV